MTKRTLLLILLSKFLLSSANCQITGMYWLDGSEIKEPLSINGITKKYFPESINSLFSYSYENKKNSKTTGIDEIVYEALTGKPLFILGTGNPSKENISKVTDQFQNQYTKSYKFIEDIKRLIERDKVDTTYIIRTLGPPNRLDKNTNTRWMYPIHKLTIKIDEDKSYDFISENYGLNIRSFFDELTGIKSFKAPFFDKFYLAKSINKGVATYFCEFCAVGETKDYAEGEYIYFLFRDGTTLKLEASIITVNSKSQPFGRIYLNSKYIPVFTTKSIKAVRLGDDITIAFTDQESKEYLEYMKVLHLKK